MQVPDQVNTFYGTPRHPNKQQEFDELAREAANCVRCPAMCDRAAILSELNGPVTARVMLIGEAPGRKGADRTRVPFSGDQSGKNLDRFLDSAGLKRSADLHHQRGALQSTRAIRCKSASERDGNQKLLTVSAPDHRM